MTGTRCYAASRYRYLTVNTGVGQTTLTLPRQGRVQARVHGGVGETTVIIPAGMAARISVAVGLGQVHVSGDFERQGGLYTSPGYATAERRFDIDLNSGIGNIIIRQELGR